MVIDNETMKMAIILAMKQKIEAFVKAAGETKDLLEAAGCYDGIANVIRECDKQIKELDKQEK